MNVNMVDGGDHRIFNSTFGEPSLHPATLRNRLAQDIANLHARSGATWGRRVAPGYE